MVEYDPADVDRFIQAADAIEDSLAGVMVDGREVEGKAQHFQVLIEEEGSDALQLVFSNQQGEPVPSDDDLITMLIDAGCPSR